MSGPTAQLAQSGTPPGLPDNWLVVRLSALGDVALTTGVLDYWHRTRGWRFAVLTNAAWAPVLEGLPAVRDIVPVERAALRPAGLRELAYSLSRRFPDYGILDLHGVLRSRILCAFWPGVVRRYPKFGVARRIFLRSGGNLFRETLLRTNVPQRYALAVESSPPPREALVPHLCLSEAERAWACERVSGIDAPAAAHSSRQMVALHPYSTHPLKAWMPERWRELALRVCERGYQVLVVGRGERLWGEHPPAGITDMTGETSLRETCAILSRCGVLVTGDSGPMHLAGGVGTPVVALFGPTHRAWGFYPEGPRDVVVEADEACRPCSLHGSKGCAGHGCMESITVARVLRGVDAVITGAEC